MLYASVQEMQCLHIGMREVCAQKAGKTVVLHMAATSCEAFRAEYGKFTSCYNPGGGSERTIPNICICMHTR